MTTPAPKNPSSLLPFSLILLFGGFAVNTVFMVLGVHGYLRELTRFSTIAGLVLFVTAVIQLFWRTIAAKLSNH